MGTGDIKGIEGIRDTRGAAATHQNAAGPDCALYAPSPLPRHMSGVVDTAPAPWHPWVPWHMGLWVPKATLKDSEPCLLSAFWGFWAASIPLLLGMVLGCQVGWAGVSPSCCGPGLGYLAGWGHGARVG